MAAALKAVPTPRPTAKVVTITPKMASDWIAKNNRNRNIRSSLVNLYARDMSTKNWQFTGEAIKFDLDGNLLDGQHRLLAIVKAGVSIPMLVIRELHHEAQSVMDSGAKRSAGDALGLRGHKNATTVAAIARFALILDGRVERGNAVSHSEIGEWVDANPNVVEAASFAMHARTSIDLRPSVTGLAWLILSQVDPHACGDFFEALMNQSTSGKGDPRSTLLRRIAHARRSGERLSANAQLQFVIRAWNSWRKNEQLHVLKVRSGDTKGGIVAVSIPKAI